MFGINMCSVLVVKNFLKKRSMVILNIIAVAICILDVIGRDLELHSTQVYDILICNQQHFDMQSCSRSEWQIFHRKEICGYNCSPGTSYYCVEKNDYAIEMCFPVNLMCRKGTFGSFSQASTDQSKIVLKVEKCPPGTYLAQNTNCKQECHRVMPLKGCMVMLVKASSTHPQIVYCDYKQGYFNTYGNTLFHYDERSYIYMHDICVRDEHHCPDGYTVLPNGTCDAKCKENEERNIDNGFVCKDMYTKEKPGNTTIVYGNTAIVYKNKHSSLVISIAIIAGTVAGVVAVAIAVAIAVAVIIKVHRTTFNSAASHVPGSTAPLADERTDLMENATNYTCNICVCHEKVTIGCYNEHILRSVPLAADRGQDDNAGHESTVWLMDARNDINDSNGSIMDCVNKLTFDYDSIAGDEGKDEIAGHDSTVWLMDGRNDINDSNGSIIDCVNKLTFDYDSIAGDEGKDDIAGDLYEATQNIEDWTTAVNRKDFNALNKLLNAGVQPNRNELDHVVTFLKDSSITKEICQKVCDYIKTKSEDIVSVWPAYRYSDRMKPDQIHVVFVVRTKTGDCEMQVDDYDIYERGISVYSLESRLIMEEESRSMKSDVFYDESVLQDLGHEIAACSDNLIKRHSNLNAISQGMKKSTGYEQMKRLHLSDQICIVIYVDVKGLIPLGEEPFPKYIGKFPTDVVEDSIISYVAGANDFHEQLIMGLAITAYAPDGKDNILTGTLGAFVEHLDFGPCVLTCAHILFSCEELERLKNNGYQAEFSNTRKHVHQPVGHRSMFFGTIKDAIYSEGTTELPGIDAALIKIEDPKRHPLSGNFPMAFNDINAGFDTENPLQYNSGRVCAITTSHLRKMVVKYGMKTAITKGYINSVGSTYIKRDITGATFHLKNQMEVIPIPSDVSFAKPGDSGALVMIDEDDGRVAIGILVAGYENSRKCFITPIVDILRGFKEDRLSLMKFDSSDSGIVAMDVS